MPSVSPESFLYNMGGGATSAAYEIWATAHRQYLILTTCQKTDTATRLYTFRCFIRLVMRYRAVLVIEGETCPLCRRDNRLDTRLNRLDTRLNRLDSKAESAQATYCCWFKPDQRGTTILNILRSLGSLMDEGEDINGLTEDFVIAKLYGDRAPNDLLDEMYFHVEMEMSIDV